MRFVLVLLLASSTAFAKDVTKELLLKGSPIPAKREFPLSKKISPCEDFHVYVCAQSGRTPLL